MKALLSVLFVTFISAQSQAQVPDYFADNPEWQQSRLCYDGQGTTQTWNWVYYLNGDTLINGQMWRKVFHRGVYEVTDFSGSGGSTFNSLIKFIRQDSMKVFTLENGTEELLYDFDLSVGDSLPATYYHGFTNTVIDSIEMITINGTQRRKFYISNAQFPLEGTYILEGMGSDIGLFEPMEQTLNCGHYFQCYQVNNVTEVGSNCNFSVDVQEPDLITQIDIYPNPFHDLIQFTIPEGKTVSELSISNSNGVLRKVRIYKSPKASDEILLEDLSPGFYFFNFTFEDGEKIEKKIVKL